MRCSAITLGEIPNALRTTSKGLLLEPRINKKTPLAHIKLNSNTKKMPNQMAEDFVEAIKDYCRRAKARVRGWLGQVQVRIELQELLRH